MKPEMILKLVLGSTPLHLQHLEQAAELWRRLDNRAGAELFQKIADFLTGESVEQRLRDDPVAGPVALFTFIGMVHTGMLAAQPAMKAAEG